MKLLDIHRAALLGDVQKVKALLSKKPKLVSSKSNKGATPLHYAVANNHKDIVELLLSHGADTNAIDN